MNLLYLIPSLSNSGGMERVLTEKVNYLCKQSGYKVFVATTEMENDEVPFFDLDPSVTVVNFNINFNSCFNYHLIKKGLKTIKLLNLYKLKLSELIVDYGIDVCISMGGKELEFLGSLNVQCKKVYECHFEKNYKSKFLEINGKKNFFWKLFGSFRDLHHSFLVSKFDLIVVLTSGAYKDWFKYSSKVLVIPNPSPIENVEKRLPDLYCKRVISIGNLVEVKGYDMLIQAWLIVFNKYPDWTLDIYGKGELKDYLQSKINLMNLDGVISLRGVTQDVKSEMLNSSFYVMSSRSEGLPMVLIESITCGLPIVSFDCETGPREIINNNDCGILVEPNNIEKLAEAIICLIENPDLISEKSLSSINKSLNFNLNLIMNRWIRVFNLLSDDVQRG